MYTFMEVSIHPAVAGCISISKLLFSRKNKMPLMPKSKMLLNDYSAGKATHTHHPDPDNTFLLADAKHQETKRATNFR